MHHAKSNDSGSDIHKHRKGNENPNELTCWSYLRNPGSLRIQENSFYMYKYKKKSSYRTSTVST